VLVLSKKPLLEGVQKLQSLQMNKPRDIQSGGSPSLVLEGQQTLRIDRYIRLSKGYVSHPVGFLIIYVLAAVFFYIPSTALSTLIITTVSDFI
jgi:hypothetical protein